MSRHDHPHAWQLSFWVWTALERRQSRNPLVPSCFTSGSHQQRDISSSLQILSLQNPLRNNLRKDPNSAVSQALRMRPQHLQRPAEIQLQHHEIPSELLPPGFQVLLICLFSSPCALASRTSKAGIIEKLGVWCSLCTVSLRHFWTLYSKQSIQRELLNSVVSQSSTWSLSTCQLMHMNWKVSLSSYHNII